MVVADIVFPFFDEELYKSIKDSLSKEEVFEMENDYVRLIPLTSQYLLQRVSERVEEKEPRDSNFFHFLSRYEREIF